MPIHFCITHGCFYSTATELNGCSRAGRVCKVKNIYYLTLNRKNWPTPDLEHCLTYSRYSKFICGMNKRMDMRLSFFKDQTLTSRLGNWVLWSWVILASWGKWVPCVLFLRELPYSPKLSWLQVTGCKFH